jgi:hypothetical protein
VRSARQQALQQAPIQRAHHDFDTPYRRAAGRRWRRLTGCRKTSTRDAWRSSTYQKYKAKAEAEAKEVSKEEEQASDSDEDT